MNVQRFFRKLYIKTTDFTRSYQGKPNKLVSFYRVWSPWYDFSVRIDPAFAKEMKKMINSVVKQGDITLDIGCGTGISTIYASKIAKKIIGIDLSPDMIARFEQKISRRKLANIEIIIGSFPEALPQNAKFDSIISSFAIVHFTSEQRRNIYKQIYNHLVNKGRLGLFSAQGEIASSFETKKEIVGNLKSAGFKNIEVEDVSDIYRIVKAEKE
jgi:cyclopropane fatty-acyl-phospholipid synthase-like methyltransferase